MKINSLHNKDKVFKESLDLFMSYSFDFFGLDNDIPLESLSTEITETTTKKAFADLVFKMISGIGRHYEWEDIIDLDDLLRFLCYNIEQSRKHKINFTTIIITNKKPRATEYVTEHITFKPIIINLSNRNADEAVQRISRQIENGEKVNLLEIIYLPLYNSPSGKTVNELLDKAIKLTPIVAKDKNQKEKLLSLLFLLTAKHISKDEIRKIVEANYMVLEGNPIFEVFEEWGIKKGREEGREEGKLSTLRVAIESGVSLEILENMSEKLDISKDKLHELLKMKK